MHCTSICAKWGRPCLPQEGEKKPPTEVEGFYN